MDADLKVRWQAASVDLNAAWCPIRCIVPKGAPSRDFRPAPLSGAGASQVGGRTRSEVAFAADDPKLRDARYFASPIPCPGEQPPAPQAQMIREVT